MGPWESEKSVSRVFFLLVVIVVWSQVFCLSLLLFFPLHKKCAAQLLGIGECFCFLVATGEDDETPKCLLRLLYCLA